MAARREDDRDATITSQIYGDPKTELDSSEPGFESGITLSTSPGIPAGTINAFNTVPSTLTTGLSMQAEGNNEPGVIVGPWTILPGHTTTNRKPEQTSERTEEDHQPDNLETAPMLSHDSPTSDHGSITAEVIRRPINNQSNTQKKKCLVVVILVTCIIIVVTLPAAGLFAATFTASSPIPNVNSSYLVLRAQTNPVVLLLSSFSSEDHSNFKVTTEIMNDAVSAVIGLTPSIQSGLFTVTYPPENYTLPQNTIPNKKHAYVLLGSYLEVSFSSLSGPVGGNVTVEFRHFIGSTKTGRLLMSQTVWPSLESQQVNYTANDSLFIDVWVINGGLSGSYVYNFTIKELNSSLVLQSQYKCTVNATNGVCQHKSIYSTNFLLASVTLDQSQYYPTINVSLAGRVKYYLPHIPTAITTIVVFVISVIIIITALVIICP